MRLLIVTQKVDKNDPILGFFHGWIIEFAKHMETLHVICLEEGEHDLPENVEVYSLGKENGQSRFKYLKNFYTYIWKLRNECDSVFVHMNQEYVLLGGIFWKMIGKKIFLWRNHAQGNIFTRIAVMFSDKVFCTSKQSFTAKFDKTKIMPVGIDISIFKQTISQTKENTFLMLGRLDPVKHLDRVIEAIHFLQKKNVRIHLDIVGDPGENNRDYKISLQDLVVKKGLEESVSFFPGIAYSEVPASYKEYGLFVNVTPSGSLDKTIFEAISSGLIPVVSNQFFKGILPDGLIVRDDSPEALADALEYAASVARSIPDDVRVVMRSLSREHSLENLSSKLISEMSL